MDVTRKPTAGLSGYNFLAPSDFTAALVSLTNVGYTGTITCYKTVLEDAQEVLTWRMTIHTAENVEDQFVYLTPPVDPAMATWVVYDSGTNAVVSYTEAAFNELFNVSQ